MKQFSVGDVVRVLDDIAKVHDLQENHGGWVDDMALVGDNNTLICSAYVQSFNGSLLDKSVVLPESSPLEKSERLSMEGRGHLTQPAFLQHLGKTHLKSQVASMCSMYPQSIHLLLNAASAASDIDGEDMERQLKLLSLLGNPAVVVAAAAAGDAVTIRDFLSNHPQDVHNIT